MPSVVRDVTQVLMLKSEFFAVRDILIDLGYKRSWPLPESFWKTWNKSCPDATGSEGQEVYSGGRAQRGTEGGVTELGQGLLLHCLKLVNPPQLKILQVMNFKNRDKYSLKPF